MKELGYILTVSGCIFLVMVGDIVIDSYFGEIACLTAIGVELIICGLLLNKFGDNIDDNSDEKRN